MKLQIICRGSKEEGLGHLFRTRTFAKNAQNKHEVEIVAITEDELKSIFNELTGIVHFVKEDKDILSYVQKYAADILLFDLTILKKEITKQIIKVPALTASLSPIFEHMPLLDICFTRSNYNKPVEGVKIFGGLEYAIFNDHCITIDDVTYEKNLMLPNFPVAVCMGGVDAANKTLKVLKSLISLNYMFTIWVLLGEGYSYSYDTLVNTVRHTHQHEIILAKTNQSMWRIMSNCTLAILAGGITSIESVYAGLPTINLFECQDHIDIMSKELIESGASLNGGLFSEDSLKVMLNKLNFLYHNRNQLRLMRESSKGLIDNNGSERVIRALERQLFLKKYGAKIQFINSIKNRKQISSGYESGSAEIF